ncbi:MAG: DUF4435 domain-containing protein [Alistipes sp.]
MADRIIDKLLRFTPFGSKTESGELPRPLPMDTTKELVEVFVEGYEDVAFWRGIFDHFTNPYLRFEISVPNREDLPKGKKVLLSMIPRSSARLLLCVDSDFDYLFDGCTPQSREVNGAQFMFHTYAYATENHLCYAPSLHNVCVKATKNDTHIFDFEKFLAAYSCTIYPVFLWYVYSAQLASENIFTLVDFKNTVQLGYLDIADNGQKTLDWVERNVERCDKRLRERHFEMVQPMKAFAEKLHCRGLTPETTYLYMQGHTLMDNVVLVMLQTVCEKLRRMSIAKIYASKKRGVAFKNEISNFQNAQRSIRDVLLDNENYTSSPLYQLLRQDIRTYIEQTVAQLKQEGKIPANTPS